MRLLTAKEAAEYLRVSLFTLHRIEAEGLLKPFRTPGGHRRYSLDMLNEYLERSRVRPRGAKKRILLVDDGEELLDLLTRTFSTCRFSRADDALRVGMKLAEFKPHMVLVNTRTPGLDALDLCQRLDSDATELKVLPFEAPEPPGKGAPQARYDRPSLGVLKESIERLLAEPS